MITFDPDALTLYDFNSTEHRIEDETMGESPQKTSIPYPTRKNHRKPKIILREQKTIAKIGMAGSLGALFVSGFIKFKGAKSLHIYSGLGLLAFTVWHHLLNQPKTKRRRQ